VAKRTGELGVALDARDPSVPAYRWLYGALRDAILRGRLRRGARLPSTRDLARQYGWSRGTVVSAFAQLEAEGYVDGTVGSGTYVAEVLPDELLEVGARGGERAPIRPAARRLSGYARRVTAFPPPEPRPIRAFRSNLPALDEFPIAIWAQLASRRLRRAPASLLLGCDAQGYRPLREAIADYLAASRGVTCRAEQVVIVAGIQEALDLVARLLLDPGDAVYLEEPGYIGARRVFEAAGARLVRGRVDAEGLVLPHRRVRGVRLVYVTPAHQYPLGVAMSLPRRLALLEWVRAHGALVVEDDYDSEFRYAGRPIPALQGLDRGGHVAFAGTLTKVMFPALRLGYLVLPPDLVERFAAARSLVSRHLPLLEQVVACDFLTEGHFGRHLRRMRQLYAERLGVLIDGARRELADWIELSPIEAGMQTIGWLADGLDSERVTEAARARDVEVFPLQRSYQGAVPRDGIQLGFAAVAPRELRRGITDLARAFAAGAGLPRRR
jgi:GntR family transcriptional regulator/MocR family aminotransferase